MTRGLAIFLTACAVVAALSILPPEHARWVGLSILGVLFVASAIPRRVQPSTEDEGQPVRGTGS